MKKLALVIASMAVLVGCSCSTTTSEKPTSDNRSTAVKPGLPR